MKIESKYHHRFQKDKPKPVSFLRQSGLKTKIELL